MIRRFARECKLADEGVIELDRTAIVKPVQAPNGHEGRKCFRVAGRRMESGPEQVRIQRMVDIVHVATQYDWRVMMCMTKRIGGQQHAELLFSFVSGQSQMGVANNQGSMSIRKRNLEFRNNCPTVFFQGDFERNIPVGLKGKPAEDCIAVTSPFQPDIALKGLMLKFQRGRKQFGLTIKLRARDAVINFLKERDVGLIMPNGDDSSAEVIAAINAADSLVDVPGQNSNQASWHRESGGALNSQAVIVLR